MTKDIQNLFVFQMQQNNNKIILTFENCDILFQMFFKKFVSRPMVHYSCTLVDIKHLINLRWLALI